MFINQINQKQNEKKKSNAGISRSVTTIIAYLISTKGMTFQQSYELVKGKRPAARPNEGFQKQLIEYEKQFLKN